ncbi:hypothetical protein CCP3SC1AL1_320019 [Gammaproteobacteria bacterium]
MAEEKVEEKKDEETPLTEEGLMKGIHKIEDLVKSLKEAAAPKEEEKKDDEKTFVQKSIDNSDEIRKGVDVAPFLEDLTSEIGDSIDKLAKSQVEGKDAIVKSLADFGTTVKESFETMKKSFDDLNERIEKLENTPIGGRKSVLVKGQERFEQPEGQKLTKAQVIDKLMDLKKSGKATTQDIAVFESSGKLKKSLVDEIYPNKEDK